MSSLNISTATRAYAVTPTDTGHASCSAFYVGVTGDVAVLTSGGDTVTFKAVPAGAIIPVQCARILAAGTTATNIIGLYG